MSIIGPGTIEGATVNIYPSGLSNDFRVTTMNITDVAAPIPAVALTDRVAMTFTNLDGAETIFVGKATVTANRVLGTTAGLEVGPGESFNVDISDAIVLYGRAEAGKTILIKVMEIA